MRYLAALDSIVSMIYTTQHICGMFKVSHQTVKNWAKEFAVYLSPTATPEHNRQRVFTEDDIRVFALVHNYRNTGKVFEDAHLALQSGQRGEVPPTAGELVPTTPPAFMALQEKINSLENALEVALLEREQALLASAADKAVRDHLEHRVNELQTRLETLIGENAVLKANKPRIDD